jgi:hypothetical protein
MAITTDHVLLTRRLVNTVREAIRFTGVLKAVVKRQPHWSDRLFSWIRAPLIQHILNATKAHEDALAVLQAYAAESMNIDPYVLEYAKCALDLNESELDSLIKTYHYNREASLISDVLPLPNTSM